MCTVTYIPTEKNEFIFTSNRDEAPKRSAAGFMLKNKHGKQILYPRDPKANGTWIAISNKNQLVCVLNGAFIKHKHLPPYRLSRGIMALDFFAYSDAPTFFKEYNFKGIEPFTMPIFDNGRLYELRWDEVEAHVKALDVNEKHIWASCTLYSPEWQAKRKEWFIDWQEKNPVINQSIVLDFHKNGGEGNPNFDVVMNWDNIVRTTSITSIINNNQQMEMRYEDLLHGKIEKDQLIFF